MSAIQTLVVDALQLDIATVPVGRRSEEKRIDGSSLIDGHNVAIVWVLELPTGVSIVSSLFAVGHVG